jgi:hypothetical protein
MATPTPDLKRDIDALFAHMTENLGHEMGEPLDWLFALRHKTVDRLERIAQELEDEFEMDLHEAVEEVDASGKASVGPPMLEIIVRDALEPAQVKELASRFEKLAASQGVTYDGVTCFEPLGEDELFEWLNLDDAVARLKHFTETGVPVGAPVVLQFAIEATDGAAAGRLLKDLLGLGFEGSQGEEEDNARGVVAYCQSSMAEAPLRERYKFVEKVAGKHGAQVYGVQFLDADDAEEPE